MSAQLAQTGKEQIPADPAQVVWNYAFEGSLAAGVTAPDSDDFNSFGPTQEYEVEAVLGRRGSGATREYKIKWKGYDGHSDESTWEVVSNVVNAKDMIEAFDEKADRAAKKHRGGGGSSDGNGGGDVGASSDSDENDDTGQDVKQARWYRDVTMICKEKVPRV